SQETRLELYALYKQSTIGDISVKEPSFWDVSSKYKWQAWKKLEQLPKEQAMTQYCE
ncbi:acyl-CoA-binding protein, partial [Gorgonomyces haynaldii]